MLFRNFVLLLFIFFTFGLPLYTKETSEQSKSKFKSLKIPVEINLCDNRVLKGKLELSIPEKIIITHEVNGLEFTKEIKIEDINTIILNGWSPELIEIKKDKGKIYRFNVTNYTITTEDALELKVKNKLPDFLEKFVFSNKYGIVILYTYWIDLLRKDNTWYTGLNGPENGERTFCYKDVVKKIIFLKKDKKDS
ncbi:MAG: hypothetical protein KatS3mg129_0730 [Leptospiraceae bacterium]|nr:MAG: hypothetical protein KatS3mg129_0730 [Leptospiraceae bacterium]